MIPTNVLYNSFILRYCMSVFVNKRNFSKLILFLKNVQYQYNIHFYFWRNQKNLQHIHMSLYIRECSLSNTKLTNYFEVKVICTRDNNYTIHGNKRSNLEVVNNMKLTNVDHNHCTYTYTSLWQPIRRDFEQH